MSILGIYSRLYGETPITTGRALLIAATGFLTVFLILGVLALFIKAMGRGFEAAARAEKKKNKPTADVPPVLTPTPAPLPANESAGKLVLTDVSEEEAALIMAIVSDRSGVPLNRLQFNSIRLLEDEV